ncbi:MAG: excisionase family DNA-binding protein [Blastochloris sp.]|nr:excisionase family DNA-binding protein [Blastochloris sp.]
MDTARRASQALAPYASRPLNICLVDQDGVEQEGRVTLPANATQLLLDILVQMADGNAVTIRSTPAELTHQHAADLLNVSRPFFVQLIENGEIPFHKVGTHTRVWLRDVVAYRERIDTPANKTLPSYPLLTRH